MIERCTTEDSDFIDMVSTNTENWDKIRDDNSPPREQFTVKGFIENPDLYFLKAVDENRPVGYFLFVPEKDNVCECHVCFLPEQRQHSIDLGREAVDWMFANTGFTKLVSRVLAGNVAVRRYAKSVGFEMAGIEEESFLKNGALHDQYIMYLDKKKKEEGEVKESCHQ